MGMDAVSATETSSDKRWVYGLWVVIIGLIVVAGAFGVAIFKVDKASISALFAGLTGVTGTIVGAYFGVQVGQSGKQESDQARDRANETVTRLAALSPNNSPEVRALLGLPLPPSS